MSVHEAWHDREAGAVDPFRACGGARDDAAAVDGDAGAAELPRPDVDEPVLEQQAQAPAAGAGAAGWTASTRPCSATLAMSTTASPGAFASSA